MSNKIKHKQSSGNVFADLGLANAEDRMLKAQLAVEIRRFIEEKEFTQSRAAEIIGIDQPKVSRLLRGQLSGFSVERLFNILNCLGHTVEVRISSRERTPEETRTIVTVG